MKRIKRFESYISESYLGGSRAPLYHTSPITNSYSILQEDKLKSTVIPDKFWSADFPAPSLISFTRSKEFVYEDYPVTFIVDGDKLEARFKVHPIDYFAKTVGHHMKPKSLRQEGEFEFEEAVQNKEINDLHKYLMEIRLNDSFFMFYKTYPRNTREEYRESYEDLVKGLIEYKKKFNTKVVRKNGKEWTLDDMENEASEFPITENIYHKDSGMRMYVSKAADEDDYKVYYSSYNPMGGFDSDTFSKYLNTNGIEHTKIGGNAVKMNKANVDKLKKSMLTLESLKDGKALTKAEINKIEYFYHATAKSNLGNIMANGIRVGPEKVVYLSDTYDNAARFLVFRGLPIIVFKVKASKLNMEKMEESFDHSYSFFKCHAFMYYGNIPKSAIDYDSIMKYNDEDKEV